MAENFAMLEYKTQEEVMTVIKYLTSFLSTTGVQILEVLSPSHLLSQLHAPLVHAPLGPAPTGEIIVSSAKPSIFIEAEK